MHLIDPLKLSVRDLLVGQETPKSPIEVATLKFGTQRHYETLSQVVISTPPGTRVIVDLTPFERAFRPPVIEEGMAPALARRRITFLAYPGELAESLLESKLGAKSRIILYGRDGRPFKVFKGARRAPPSLQRGGERSTLPISVLHAQHASDLLLKFARMGMTDGRHAQLEVRARLSGEWFVRLPNGMLASHYLNTKVPFGSPTCLLDAAYEVVRFIYRSFRRDLVVNLDGKVLVAPSHNALMLASAVHAICGIDLAVVDKLGPLPSRHLAAISASTDVRGKAAILLVDVSSTGSEIDRAIQYLEYRRARTELVVCAYNWAVGRPILCSRSMMRTLCRPMGHFKYVYRSDSIRRLSFALRPVPRVDSWDIETEK